MPRGRRRWVWIALALLVATSMPLLSQASLKAEPVETRLALVIGNGAYDGKDRLPTATADAGLIAGALAQDGFDVTAMGDVDAVTIRKTVALFVEKARAAAPSATLFVYLSGVGLQYAGGNYFVPVGAQIARQADVPTSTVALSEITGALDALPVRARFYVFDLARPNAFAGDDALPLPRGLVSETPKDGALYAFNTAPGALGGREIPPYGLYARSLAEMLRTPGLSVEQLFRRVRLRTTEMSGGAIVPWDDAAGLDDLVILPTAGGKPAPATVEERILAEAAASELYWAAIARDRLDGYRAFLQTFPDDKQAVRVRDMIAVRLEALTWAAAVHADLPSAYWTFMRRFPRGPHYVDVRRRLATLSAALEPPPRYDVFPFDGLPPPTPDETAAVTRAGLASDAIEWPQVPPPPSGLLPSPPDAFTIGLPPPPLVPDGVLPAPSLLPSVETAAVGRAGRIVQPFVRGKGRVTIDYPPPPAPMVLAAEGTPISTTTTTTLNDARTVLQTAPDGHILSRTVTTRGAGATTTVQTGPGGGIVSKMTTRDEAGGTRTTTIVNSANQLVAEVKTDSRGVVVGVRRGEAPHEDETFGLVTPRSAAPRPEAVRPAAPALPALRNPIGATRPAQAGPAGGSKAPVTSPAPPAAAEKTRENGATLEKRAEDRPAHDATGQTPSSAPPASGGAPESVPARPKAAPPEPTRAPLSSSRPSAAGPVASPKKDPTVLPVPDVVARPPSVSEPSKPLQRDPAPQKAPEPVEAPGSLPTKPTALPRPVPRPVFARPRKGARPPARKAATPVHRAQTRRR